MSRKETIISYMENIYKLKSKGKNPFSCRFDEAGKGKTGTEKSAAGSELSAGEGRPGPRVAAKGMPGSVSALPPPKLPVSIARPAA